ncbi:MAG: phage major capsid protein [Coriobacteriia bacterium]|nr:phage major capsid protein [Coriobacteriia bacterium]
MNLKDKHERLEDLQAQKVHKQKEIAALEDKVKAASEDDVETLQKEAKAMNESAEKLSTEITELEADIAKTHAVLDEVGNGIADGRSKSKIEAQSSGKDYLDTKQALLDYAKIIADNVGKDLHEVNKSWADHLASKGVTNPDVLLPRAVINKIVDRFEDPSGIFGSLNRHAGFSVWSNMLNVATGDSTRARGHKRGKDKKEQEITLKEKVARAGYVYKYITIPKDLVKEAQASGAALLAYILDELPKRVITEIERAVVIGDGRASTDDSKVKSFEAIVDADTGYKVDIAATGVLFRDIMLAVSGIKAEGPKYLVINSTEFAKLKVDLDNNGALRFPIGTDFESMFGVAAIFTPEWMDAAEEEGDPVAVIYAGDAYDVVGDNIIESYENFILKKNSNEYLAELWAGGALLSPDAAAVVVAPKEA